MAWSTTGSNHDAMTNLSAAGRPHVVRAAGQLQRHQGARRQAGSTTAADGSSGRRSASRRRPLPDVATRRADDGVRSRLTGASRSPAASTRRGFDRTTLVRGGRPGGPAQTSAMRSNRVAQEFSVHLSAPAPMADRGARAHACVNYKAVGHREYAQARPQRLAPVKDAVCLYFGRSVDHGVDWRISTSTNPILIVPLRDSKRTAPLLQGPRGGSLAALDHERPRRPSRATPPSSRSPAAHRPAARRCSSGTSSAPVRR